MSKLRIYVPIPRKLQRIAQKKILEECYTYLKYNFITLIPRQKPRVRNFDNFRTKLKLFQRKDTF